MTAVEVPLYLAKPTYDRETFGRLERQQDYWYIRDGHPALLEMAKRVLPGCEHGEHGRRSSTLRFKATRRAVGDLNWIMLRYPLYIEHPNQFEIDRQAAISHATRREQNQNIDVAVPPAMFKGQLINPFQGEGVSFLTVNRRTLLADDMGLGKTVQALAALVSVSAFPALVVCTPNTTRQWVKMAEAFLDLPTGALFADQNNSFCQIIKGLKPYQLKKRHIYITHYGLLRGWKEELRSMGLKTVIFDEIQELRHANTQKYSIASLIAGDADYVWGLSGTPIYNYGSEIWSVLNILDYHCLGDWESFSREWCDGYGQKIVVKPELLNDHLRREGLMIRRVKEDVQGQLPPKRRVVHAIDHDEDLYADLIREASAIARRYDSLVGRQERGEAQLYIEGASRKATGVSKAPYVGEFVRSLIEAGERPLVYAWHHEVHAQIRESLGKHGADGAMITGQQTPAQKIEAIEAFAKGNLHYMQLSLRSTAGINGLQERATCVVFGELDWSPAAHSQCEDRAHRMGINKQLESLLCYYLVSQTGYDGVIMNALGLKIGQFVGIMGDRAQTEDDRQRSIESGREHLRKVIGALNTLGSA